MEQNRKIFRKILAACFIITFIALGCIGILYTIHSFANPKKIRYTIYVRNGLSKNKRFSWSEEKIQCDSFKMIAYDKCLIWNDGAKSIIIAEEFSPSTN